MSYKTDKTSLAFKQVASVNNLCLVKNKNIPDFKQVAKDWCLANYKISSDFEQGACY